MSRRHVDKIAAISATIPPTPVDVGQTTSILSDPDGRWVAARQSAITAGPERRVAAQTFQGEGNRARFSGESERIGKWLSDETTPFGKRVGYI